MSDHRLTLITRLACFCSLCLISAGSLTAQMIHQAVPFQNFGSSFYENNGVNLGIRGNGFNATFGNQIVPPFGGFDPNAGLNSGIGFSGNGYAGGLGFNLNQGSSRSFSSTTPSLTTTNGYPGYISSQTMRPFVTSVTPIVGGQVILPTPIPPTAEQRMSVYQQAQQEQLQERAVANQQVRQDQAYESFERGKRAEEAGKLRMARANYRNALRAARGPLRETILQRMRQRGW